MKIRHILLTTDLSPDAERAFAPTRELARTLGARITLLHVAPVHVPPTEGSIGGAPMAWIDPTEVRRVAQRGLDESRERLGKDVEFELELVLSNHAAEEIVRIALERGADLIALSTHGRTGLRRLVLGSVAEGVLRRTRVPVLCFPPKE
jgi:nucleotide-binding universal stress UspA family protein